MFIFLYFEMKKFALLWIILPIILIAWCDNNHNFMDVDNTNAKKNLQNLIWSWNIPKINSNDIITDSVSWTRKNIKWQAEKYYTGKVEWYVDKAKEWLSWATQKLKWFYNEWVDEINWAINEKVNWEMNKFKIK